MAVPKRKTSKTRRDKRRTHYKITATDLTACPRCREPRLPHRVCPHCGYYRDRQVTEGE